MSPQLLLLAHAGATWALVGLIWTIQIVHYPLFAQVGAESFVAYEQSHTSRITLVVAPLMFAELGLAAALLLQRPEELPLWSVVLGAAMVAGVWLSTFLIQVPLHGRLANGFDAAAHAALVGTNWIRTALWSGRGVLSLWMLWKVSG